MGKQSSGDGTMLIIVESPTKAKTIKKFLPANCTVVASNGHVRDLPAKELGIDVADGFKPNYVVVKGKEKIIKDLKSELAVSSSLMLATDEDREGESISWHLLEVLKPKVPFRRMVFHEITKKAILSAVESGRELDMDLVNAQEARRVLDRLYGYDVSPVLWKKLGMSSLSAGRVQSPGLRLIVERERQRIAFVKSQYWDVSARLAQQGRSQTFTAKLDSLGGKRVASGKDFDATTGELKTGSKTVLLDRQKAEDLAKRLQSADWHVLDVQEKEKIQRPSPPFITSTLQQEANRKLRLGAKDTMKIAQKLYESGLITYMRTDSPTLSQEGIRAARDAAGTLFGMDYLSPASRQYASHSASAQEAHEAIRPAGDKFLHPDQSGLKGRDLALYDMIWKRTLASQMADAVKAVTTVRIQADDAQFTASGNRIVFAGFIKVYVEGHDDAEEALEDEESLLPALATGEPLDVKQLTEEQHETKPPARYTEATLVQELEKRGIGRPSTYASIIEKLLDKDYVVKEANALVPTFVAFAVVQLLERNFTDLVDYTFTSNMENALDEIAKGTLDRGKFLTDFYNGESGLAEQVKQKMATIKGAAVKQIDIPGLTAARVLLGKYGPYVQASSTQEGAEPTSAERASLPETVLPSTITDELVSALLKSKTESKQSTSLGTDPASGLPVLLLEGKYGPYYQLGEKGPDNPIPKRANVPKGMDGAALPLSYVLKLLNLPLVLGVHPVDGHDVIAGVSRFGPFVACDKEFRSLESMEQLFNVTLEEALQRLAAPKPTRGSNRAPHAASSATEAGAKTTVSSFGEYEGKPLAIHLGRYGYYGKLGDENFTLPYQMRKDQAAVAALQRDEVIAFALAPKKEPPKKGFRKKTSTRSVAGRKTKTAKQ